MWLWVRVWFFLRFKCFPAQSEEENMDFYFDDIPSTSQSISSFREYSARVNIVNFNSLNIKYINQTIFSNFLISPHPCFVILPSVV